jgi:deoxyribonuclease-4
VLWVGVHVSISGGLSNAPERAFERGCTAFQIFTRNPRGWRYQDITPDEASMFGEKVSRYGFDDHVMAHMPYLPNLASPDERIYKLSLDSLINEVSRTGQLGINYLVIHLGSHMGMGKEVGRKNIVNAVEMALDKVDNDVIILLENMAGQKNSMGSRFEDIAILIDSISYKDRIGVCFDTSHAFSAGYDLRDKESVSETLREFDRVIGFRWLRVVHINDSRVDLGKGRDIHEHIGLGYIGEDGFRYLLSDQRIRRLPLILETPVDDRREDVGNIMKVWELSGEEPPDDLKVRWRAFLATTHKDYAKGKRSKK